MQKAKIIVANWKSAPATSAEAQAILNATDEYLGGLAERAKFSLVFCPPFIFLEDVAKILRLSHLEHQAELGAQDIALEDSPAQTGEITGPMLAKLGVRYVIVGHSERRWGLGESDKIVNGKLRLALRHELVPIVCIGERDRGIAWEDEIADQVRATFDGLSEGEISRCIIAYEPVWAISTNNGAQPDTPENALESIKLIREVLGADAARFLYGGSVTELNAAGFLAVSELDGVIVGGASVRKEEFLKILADASHIAQ